MRRSFGRTAVLGALCSLTAVAAVDASVDGEVASPPEQAVCVAGLDVGTKAGQVLLVLVDDPADATTALTDLHVAGLAPFGTVDDRELAQLAGLLDEDPAALGTMVASDEEGGRVQRFGTQFGRLPSAAVQAATMTPEEVEAMYAAYGESLADAGVDVVFAPVVDVGAGPAIGDRSYGADPAVVTAYARAAVAGYRRAGLLPVLKHFPGHGGASADTHAGAATTPPLEALRASDLVPYGDLLDGAGDAVGVMVGHLDVPGLTNGDPASMSAAAITGLLRGEFGFDGLVVSDALGMGAITTVTSGPDAVVRFLAAGGDLAIVDLADVAASHRAVLSAVAGGTLDAARLDEAVGRVLAAKSLATRCLPNTPAAPTDAPAVDDPVVDDSSPDEAPAEPVAATWATRARSGAIGAIVAVDVIRRAAPGPDG